MMELWPFTNFHDMNLDWIIRKIKNVETSEANAKASEEAAAESADDAAGRAGLALIYQNKAKDYRDEAQGFANDAAQRVDDAQAVVDSINGVVNQVNVNTAQISSLIANAGDGTVPSELIDIRIAADGTTYSTAGDAVRAQSLYTSMPALQRIEDASFYENGAWGETGNPSANAARMRTVDFLPSNCKSVTCTASHTFVVGGWDSSGTYQGWLKTNNNIQGGSANIAQLTLFDCAKYRAKYPGYQFKIALKNTDNSNVDVSTACQDVTLTMFDYSTLTYGEQLNDSFNSLDENVRTVNNFILIESAGDNVYAVGDRHIPVEAGKAYVIDLVDYPHSNVPTVGAGTLFDYTLINNGVSSQIRKIVQTETLDTDYLVFIPPDAVDPELAVGGRVNNGENALISITEADPDFLPSYMQTVANNLKAALYTVQTSASSTFAFLTDPHIETNYKYNKGGIWSMEMFTRTINTVRKDFPLFMTVLNGDYVDNATTTPVTTFEEIYNVLRRTFNRLTSPQWRGTGNHDYNDMNTDPAEQLTDEAFYKLFVRSNSTVNFHYNYGYMDRDYGYKDDENAKIRYIFVNTADTPAGYDRQHNTGVSDEQIQFISKALEFTEPDWGVVFISHHLLENNATLNPGNWAEGYLDPDHGGTPLMGVIGAFQAGTTYTYTSNNADFPYNISVDFTANASNEVIAMFNGHLHRDATDVVNGYAMIECQNASNNGTYYDINETSWSIVTINRLDKEIYVERAGRGTSVTVSYA